MLEKYFSVVFVYGLRYRLNPNLDSNNLKKLIFPL